MDGDIAWSIQSFVTEGVVRLFGSDRVREMTSHCEADVDGPMGRKANSWIRRRTELSLRFFSIVSEWSCERKAHTDTEQR